MGPSRRSASGLAYGGGGLLTKYYVVVTWLLAAVGRIGRARPCSWRPRWPTCPGRRCASTASGARASAARRRAATDPDALLPAASEWGRLVDEDEPDYGDLALSEIADFSRLRDERSLVEEGTGDALY